MERKYLLLTGLSFVVMTILLLSAVFLREGTSSPSSRPAVVVDMKTGARFEILDEGGRKIITPVPMDKLFGYAYVATPDRG